MRLRRPGLKGGLRTALITQELRPFFEYWDSTHKKAPDLSTWGFFIYIWCTRRRLNWRVRAPYSLGMFDGESVRHTRGHTRRFLLATFFVVSP